MINRKHILAITSNGEWFNTQENIDAFKAANPTAFIAKVGDKATIMNRRLMSYNTTGKIIGFDQTSTGKFLVMVKWDKDAAPLRVGIKSIMPNAPEKFWMAIPFNSSGSARQQAHFYDGSSRRNGVAPAVQRFESLTAAQRYVAGERRATRFNDYVILESVQFHAGEVVVPM